MRFVLSNRRAGKFIDEEKIAARRQVDSAAAALLPSGAELIGSTVPDDASARATYVLESTAEEVNAKARDFGDDVIIEREIPHYPQVTQWQTILGYAPIPTFSAGDDYEVNMIVQNSDGTALKGISVSMALRSSGGQLNALTQLSGEAGKVSFQYSSAWTPLLVIAMPPSGYWPAYTRVIKDGAVISLIALPELSDAVWWRSLVGAHKSRVGTGARIRVGIADTGVGPHPCLEHVQLVGAFVNGASDLTSTAARDVQQHGTHIAGIIGSRPRAKGQARGIAVDCQILAARIYPGKETSANQGDIANAIDYLSRQLRADLINLSLGSSQPSAIELDAIRDALERGSLCICAAGNSADSVQFPAAFDETVAVSALGLTGWAPEGTLEAAMSPDTTDRYGFDGLFLAKFSCFGAPLDAAGPGVGVISTVPTDIPDFAPFAVMDGTSMSSPAVTAAVAAALSVNDDYVKLPRDVARSEVARRVLRDACRNVGLQTQYQGLGVPRVDAICDRAAD